MPVLFPTYKNLKKNEIKAIAEVYEQMIMIII